MNQENIGKLIASLRKEKALTQEQLAEVLGVNSRSVSRWENGNCKLWCTYAWRIAGIFIIPVCSRTW